MSITSFWRKILPRVCKQAQICAVSYGIDDDQKGDNWPPLKAVLVNWYGTSENLRYFVYMILPGRKLSCFFRFCEHSHGDRNGFAGLSSRLEAEMNPQPMRTRVWSHCVCPRTMQSQAGLVLCSEILLGKVVLGLYPCQGLFVLEYFLIIVCLCGLGGNWAYDMLHIKAVFLLVS